MTKKKQTNKHKNKTKEITILRARKEGRKGENMWKSMTPENKLLSLSLV